MKKLLYSILLISQSLTAQNLGFNGAGFFENYDADVEKYLLEMNQPFTLRVPGGAISKFHDPYNVKSGWGMTEANIKDWFNKTGFDEDGNGLEKWLRKAGEQPDHSFLEDMIKLQKTFPQMQVIYVLNVLNSTPEKNMQAIRYLMQNKVNVVGVEAGNEVYGKYASFAEYVNDFEPIFKLMEKEYPQIKLGLVAGANTGRKDIVQWNEDLSKYKGNYDAVIMHYYYTQKELSEVYDMIPLRSEYMGEDTKRTDLEKAYQKAAEQLLTKKLFIEGINYAGQKFPGKKIWVTEWNTKPSEMLGNTLVNGAWQFKEMVELRDRIEYFCVHNGVGPDKYGMITKSNKYDSESKTMLKRTGYWAYILASETDNGISLTKETKYTLKADNDKKVYYYFTNMNEAFSANIDKNNLNVESATIHYLSGKHLYSAAGTTGYMGKGSKPTYEIKGIKTENFSGTIPANSFGYVVYVLK